MSPALPTLSTSLVNITRTALTLRYRWIWILEIVSALEAGPDSLHNPPRPVPRRGHRVTQVAVEDAFLRRQRRFVLAPDVLRARLDERLHREDAQRKHVELAQHRDPGRKVDRADDHAQRRQQHRLRRAGHPAVAQQAVGELAVSRHLHQNLHGTRKQWHWGRGTG